MSLPTIPPISIGGYTLSTSPLTNMNTTNTSNTEEGKAEEEERGSVQNTNDRSDGEGKVKIRNYVYLMNKYVMDSLLSSLNIQ